MFISKRNVKRLIVKGQKKKAKQLIKPMNNIMGYGLRAKIARFIKKESING